jgi:hypothetical protein
MDDPIERLKGLKPAAIDEDADVVVAVAPKRDGIFPKTVVIRMASTHDLITEGVVNKGERFTFVPPASGSYIIDIYPKETDNDDFRGPSEEGSGEAGDEEAEHLTSEGTEG